MTVIDRAFLAAIAVSVAWFFGITLFRLTLLNRWTTGQQHRWLREVARDVALAFGPLALTVLVWEYWLRGPRTDEMTSAIAHTMEVQGGELNSIRQSGIIKIWTDSNQTQVRTFMKSARHRLVFLAPWFLDPTTVDPVLRELCALSQPDITIMLVNPASQYARIRGAMLTGNEAYGPSESRRSIDAMIRVAGSCKSSRMHLLLFDTMPMVYLVVADDRALIGFFSHVGTALDTPILECRLSKDDGKPTDFGVFVEAELRKVVAASQTQELPHGK